MFQSFHELTIPERLSANLKTMGFLHPTPIQRDAIPVGLKGRDLLGTAQTGTGKTGAFAVPLLAKLAESKGKKKGLILAPTRELASQIREVMEALAIGMGLKGTLVVGGESFGRQARDFRVGVDYIVATPGRLVDHIQQRTVDLRAYQLLVLDEVDRMMDMGFIPQIREIVGKLPKERQTMVFSATLPQDVRHLVDSLLRNPINVSIQHSPESKPKIKEETVKTTALGKRDSILKELGNRTGLILVFTRTQSRTDKLVKILRDNGHKAVGLHGGRTQGQRKQALEAFRDGSHRIMVATDLAGRGIDVENVEHVINYDLPLTREDYIHRIGRTGRFGKTGIAVSFMTDDDRHGDRIVHGGRKATQMAQAAYQRPKPSAAPSHAHAPTHTPKHAPAPTHTPTKAQPRRRMYGHGPARDVARPRAHGHVPPRPQAEPRAHGHGPARVHSRPHSRPDFRSDSRADSRSDFRSGFRSDSRSDSRSGSRSGSFGGHSRGPSRMNTRPSRPGAPRPHAYGTRPSFGQRQRPDQRDDRRDDRPQRSFRRLGPGARRFEAKPVEYRPAQKPHKGPRPPGQHRRGQDRPVGENRSRFRVKDGVEKRFGKHLGTASKPH